MARRPLVILATVASVVALALPGRSQEAPKAEAPKPEATKAADERSSERGSMPRSTVRVSLVITRYQGDKKVASLPYTLVVGTGTGIRTRMRMGVDTPVPVAPPVVSEPGAPKPPMSFQYRNVGTNVDCAVWERDRMSEAGQRETVYRLSLSVENSSAFSGPDARVSGGGVEGAPLFRRFDTAIDLALRDGQKTEVIASTDPVTGEVVKIDVSLNVVK